VIAVIGLTTAAAAGLSVTGVVDRPAEAGCITTESDNRATVASETARPFAGPSPNSDSLGLVLRGCKLRYGGYCIGAVHRDASENTVLDSSGRTSRIRAVQGSASARAPDFQRAALDCRRGRTAGGAVTIGGDGQACAGTRGRSLAPNGVEPQRQGR
jgi:hypothetical protein